MLAELLKVSFRILLFRAGPEDFPYAADGRWDQLALGLGIVATTALFSLVQPLPLALIDALVATAVVHFYSRLVLRMRGLDARHAQTRNALLACGGLLLAALCVPMAATLPQMMAYVDTMIEAQQAAGAGTAPARPALPQIPLLYGVLIDVLGLWFAAVQTHILSRATGVAYPFAVFMALLLIGNVVVAMVLVGNVVAALLG